MNNDTILVCREAFHNITVKRLKARNMHWAAPLWLYAVLLAVLYFHLPGTRASTQWVGRIAYLNDMINIYTDDFYSPEDGGVSQIQESMAPIAVMVFNERRYQIIPALKDLNCNKNLTIKWMCAGMSDPLVSFRNLLELAQLPQDFPHFVIGPEESSEAISAAMVAAAEGAIPVVSNWATSPDLSDPNLYPTFTRTIPSDSALALLASKLIKDLGYNNVALIYESGAFGTGLKDVLNTDLESLNINLKFQDYVTGDEKSIENALQITQQTQLNVILFVIYNVDLAFFGKYWKSLNLEAQTPLPIFLGLSSLQTTLSDASGNDDVTVMLQGSLMTNIEVPPNPLWANFLNLYQAGEFAIYRPQINEMFPPNGLANSNLSCPNWARSYPVPLSYLDGSKSNLVEDIWAWTFDTVITGGLALCNLYPTDPLPDSNVSITSSTEFSFGQNLYKEIMNLDFYGLSGHINFDKTTGDRNPLTSYCVVYGFIQTGVGEIRSERIGNWNPDLNVWQLNLSTANFKSGIGVLSHETVPPVENFNYLAEPFKILGYTEVGLLSFACLYCIIWLKLHEKSRIVVNAQGKLLMLMCLGCLLASWSILTFTSDDAPNDPFNANICCMTTPVLFTIGFQIALFAVIGKLIRIAVLFRTSFSLKRYSYSIYRVLKFIGIGLVMETILVIIWISVAPLTFQRVILETDTFGNPVDSIGECVGGLASVIFVVIVFTLHAVGVVVTGVLSSFVKHLPMKYQESRFLNYAVLTMAQIYILAIPTFIAVYQSPTGRFIIGSTVVMITVASLLLFLIVPKMFPSTFDIEGTYEEQISKTRDHTAAHISTTPSTFALGPARVLDTNS